MLFGRRKKVADELFQHMDEAFFNNGKSMADLEKKLTEQLQAAREESSKMLRRQSGSLEDILEELQRQGEEKENTEGQLLELKKREKELAELCCFLLGQKEMILKQLLEEGVLPENVRSGWQKQADIMEQESERLERRCSFQRIGICGEKVDYDRHEILSVCPARRLEEDGTIARVFSRGYYYQGHILKKAQVAAYKYSDDTAGARGMPFGLE